MRKFFILFLLAANWLTMATAVFYCATYAPTGPLKIMCASVLGVLAVLVHQEIYSWK